MRIFTLCLLLVTVLAGCRKDDRRDAPTMSQRELMNRSMLQPYPEAVRASFMRDYPTVTVTSVDTFNDVSGRVVYEINFADEGRVMDVAYTSEGMRVAQPNRAVAPAPQPAPPASPRDR